MAEDDKPFGRPYGSSERGFVRYNPTLMSQGDAIARREFSEGHLRRKLAKLSRYEQTLKEREAELDRREQAIREAELQLKEQSIVFRGKKIVVLLASLDLFKDKRLTRLHPNEEDNFALSQADLEEIINTLREERLELLDMVESLKEQQKDEQAPPINRPFAFFFKKRK